MKLVLTSAGKPLTSKREPHCVARVSGRKNNATGKCVASLGITRNGREVPIKMTLVKTPLQPGR